MYDEEFQIINENYIKFHKHLLKKGKLPQKDTGIGYWGVTPLEETYELFKRINLTRYKSFIDLGSGDGRIVLLASLFEILSHGIEYDPGLVNTSLFIRRKMNLPHFSKTKIIENDFMETDLSQYGLIFSSPDKPFYREGFEEKLLREMKGELIVHGWEFHPRNLKKKEEHVINGEKFCVYSK